MADSIFANDPIPVHVVRTYSCSEVTEYDKHVSFRSNGDEGVQLFLELVLHFFRVCHDWSIGAGDGDMLFFQRREGVSWS